MFEDLLFILMKPAEYRFVFWAFEGFCFLLDVTLPNIKVPFFSVRADFSLLLASPKTYHASAIYTL